MTRSQSSLAFASLAVMVALATIAPAAHAADRPNIIFVMADDMGWGQTGYYSHPVLKTPNLDAMAANGLRFDRFYAGCPVCSPTRASVMTGRANDRTGVLSHGYALRLQEKTVAQALQQAGYVTGHFGKWHLDGFRGPGAPVLKEDPRSPGAFGFDEWLSVTNFFDQNPLMSHGGEIVEFKGDSSEIVVAEASKFIEKHHAGDKPLFAVIWYGTPHSPFRALPEDQKTFSELDEQSSQHYGELAAMDRSMGALRSKLKKLGIADNTMLVFCSDNGGLPGITPDTVGGLRGNKGTIFEGGLRVPGIIEWPAVITQPRVTSYPACTYDLFPTVADLLNLPADVMIAPVDGVSLAPLLTKDIGPRERPLTFRYGTKAALIDNRYKVLTQNVNQDAFELYDLEVDPKEAHELSSEKPELFQQMKQRLLDWNDSVEASFAGKDYPAGAVVPPDPEPINWYDAPSYQPYVNQWKDRWEYSSYINRKNKAKTDKPRAKSKKNTKKDE